MNIFKKKTKKVANDVTQTEIVNKVGKGSLFMKTIGMISSANTNPTMDNTEITQMTTINSPEIPRTKSASKASKSRGGDLKNSDAKGNTFKADTGGTSGSRSGAAKVNVVEGKSKGNRSRAGKAVVERPTSIRLNAVNSITTSGISDVPASVDLSQIKRKTYVESEQKKETDDVRSSIPTASKIPAPIKPPSSTVVTNNLNSNSTNNTKEIFWEIANFDLSKPVYESNTFSYADQCWNFIFGHNGSENYGFLMSLHQPQIASIQFKCTFKLHHPFAFPLSKTREEPYVFGINARTIRGFVNFASREEVNRHVQEGGILKLSAVLKLGTVVLVHGMTSDNNNMNMTNMTNNTSSGMGNGNGMGGSWVGDDREKDYTGHALYTSSFISDTQATKMTCDNDKIRSRTLPIPIPSSPTESEGDREGWMQCLGCSFAVFKSTASFKRFLSSLMQRNSDKKEKEKRKRKEVEVRGRSFKEEGSYGLFSRRLGKSDSDNENDSNGDDERLTGWKYSTQRDSSRRGGNVNEKESYAKGGRGDMSKGKYREDIGDSDSRTLRRDNSEIAPNREIQNLLISRKDILSGRDGNNDTSPNSRKNARHDERTGAGKSNKQIKDNDNHERNKSFSPESSRGIEKKTILERHCRHNSSMI